MNVRAFAFAGSLATAAAVGGFAAAAVGEAGSSHRAPTCSDALSSVLSEAATGGNAEAAGRSYFAMGCPAGPFLAARHTASERFGDAAP